MLLGWDSRGVLHHNGPSLSAIGTRCLIIVFSSSMGLIIGHVVALQDELIYDGEAANGVLYSAYNQVQGLHRLLAVFKRNLMAFPNTAIFAVLGVFSVKVPSLEVAPARVKVANLSHQSKGPLCVCVYEKTRRSHMNESPFCFYFHINRDLHVISLCGSSQTITNHRDIIKVEAGWLIIEYQHVLETCSRRRDDVGGALFFLCPLFFFPVAFLLNGPGGTVSINTVGGSTVFHWNMVFSGVVPRKYVYYYCLIAANLKCMECKLIFSGKISNMSLTLKSVFYDCFVGTNSFMTKL